MYSIYLTNLNQVLPKDNGKQFLFKCYSYKLIRIFFPHRIRSISPTDNKYLIQGFLRKYTHIEPFHPDVRSTITKLLDNVETNINEQTTRRKSSCQNQILPCSSLDQHLSPTLPIVPLRPLSVSPTRYIIIMKMFKID